MKNRFWLFMMLMAVVTMAFSMPSCSDSDDDYASPPDGGDVVATETTIELTDHQLTTKELTFNASANWRVKSDAEWIKLTPLQGTAGANKRITVTVSENLSGKLRIAVVNVETIESETLVAKFTINQPAREEVAVDDENPAAPAGMKKNATGMVKAIRVGWNLGNTCESSPWEGWSGNDLEVETLWGNPYTTKAMITALKDAGFNAIRIPTRWYAHADADLNINSAWMARIKEIAGYAVEQDMYVIVNSHHDNWYDRLPAGYDEQGIHMKYINMWTQIANAFKDYDEHLILAGANEIIKLSANGTEDWGTPTDSEFEYANKLMQLFVNTVRATGGNNQWRCLMVEPWAASPSNALADGFKMPADDTPHRIIVEYHCYDPYHYAIGKDLPDNQYAQHEFADADRLAITDLFAKLNEKFVVAGVPCIMAEFGSTQDNSYSGGEAEADDIRAGYHKFIVSEAKKYNIPSFYWDNNAFNGTGENFGLLDRSTCLFSARAQVALDGIMQGLK